MLNLDVDAIGTDSTGPSDYNLTLSQSRAQVVAQILISQNVQRERLVVLGLGEANPIAPDDTEAGRRWWSRVPQAPLHTWATGKMDKVTA